VECYLAGGEGRMRLHEVVKHPLSLFKRKTLYSILLVILILAIGTEVMHILEG